MPIDSNFRRQNSLPELRRVKPHHLEVEQQFEHLKARRDYIPRKRRIHPFRWAMLILLAIVIASAVAIYPVAAKLYSFGSNISSVSPFSTQFLFTGSPINILVMGYGGAGHDGAYLTDSMEVISIDPSSHKTAFISVPRDLWVQVPQNSGNYSKLNYAYQYGHDNGGPSQGGDLAAQEVSQILGMPISSWVTIDFQGFRQLIDTIGGVDVNVQTAFTARYPANDDASINASWMTVHFNTGLQHMDGAQAIEYARARYVLRPLSEGTDFARSARQQILMKAIADKLKDHNNWGQLYSAMDALQSSVFTNVSMLDFALLYTKADFTNPVHITLSNQNVLKDSVSSDGQAILIPKNNDFGVIQQYVQQQMQQAGMNG